MSSHKYASESFSYFYGFMYFAGLILVSLLGAKLIVRGIEDSDYEEVAVSTLKPSGQTLSLVDDYYDDETCSGIEDVELSEQPDFSGVVDDFYIDGADVTNAGDYEDVDAFAPVDELDKRYVVSALDAFLSKFNEKHSIRSVQVVDKEQDEEFSHSFGEWTSGRGRSVYGPWSPWSECSSNCGDGHRYRWRDCLLGDCPKEIEEEEQECDYSDCQY